MSHIDTQYQTFDSRIGIEVQRHNGAWSDAESAFVHPNEDPAQKQAAMNARLQWYRENNPQFTYRLVYRLEVTQVQVTVLDEAEVEVPTLSVPDDLSGLDES